MTMDRRFRRPSEINPEPTKPPQQRRQRIIPTPNPDIENASFNFRQGVGAPRDINAQGGTGPRFRTWKVDNTTLGFEVEFYDLRGGLGVTEGIVQENWDRTSEEEGVWNQHYGFSTLSPLVTAATSPDPTGDLVGIHHAQFLNEVAIGLGSGADVALYGRTSATDPAIVAKIYTPTSSITGLWPVKIGSVTAAERLAICRLTDPVQIVSTWGATPTVDATMDASTDPCFGILQSPLPGQPLLLYMHTSAPGIYALGMESAATTAPTLVKKGWPLGGAALGIMTLGKIFAFWLWPYENNTAGALKFGAEKPLRVMVTTVEGKDQQPLDFGFPDGVGQAALMPYRGGVVAHNYNGDQIAFHNGDRAEPLRIFDDLPGDSDKVYKMRGIWIDGPDLYVRVQRKASANGTGNTQISRWRYDFDLNSWHQPSPWADSGTTGDVGVLAGGALPKDASTGFGIDYAAGSWRNQLQVPYGINPYMLRQTSGAQANTGIEYEASGSSTSPELRLMGLFPNPCVVESITFGGNVAAGGSGASAKIDVAVTDSDGRPTFTNPVTATFSQGARLGTYQARFPDNKSAFYLLKVKETLTRDASNTRKTPQGLPFTVRGLCFLDGNVKSPKEVLGA